MARLGRRPQPRAVKELKGVHKSLINYDEPTAPDGTPVCPRWLSKRAKACWREVVPHLKAMNVLTKVDRHALISYCDAWGRYRDTRERLDAVGDTYELKSGYVQQRPEVGIVRQLQMLLLKYQQEFGLTPSSRTTIKVEHATGTKTGLDAFLDEGFKIRKAASP